MVFIYVVKINTLVTFIYFVLYSIDEDLSGPHLYSIDEDLSDLYDVYILDQWSLSFPFHNTKYNRNDFPQMDASTVPLLGNIKINF